jgi:flap endonuclease-1
MGVSDFYPTFKEICPQAFQLVNFKDLHGWRIAIDVSIFLFKFVKTRGDMDTSNPNENVRSWLDGFILFTNTLKRNMIKPVFVFDGPNPPIEKQPEQQQRRETAAKNMEKFIEIRDVYDRVSTTGVITKKDIEVCETYLSEKGLDYTSPSNLIHTLKDIREKLEIQNTPITKEQSIIAKRFIEIMGCSYIQADGEAEGMCAFLAKRGDVDAVMTEDTDVLLYGAPMMFSKIDVASETCCAIRRQDLLDGAHLTSETFVDMCILLGVDYNCRVKGMVPGKKKMGPVGPKAAIKLIQEYGTIDKFCHLLENEGECLKWKRCREIFSLPEHIPQTVVPYSKTIDEVSLKEFLIERYGKDRYFSLITSQNKPKVELVFE